jgi:hypothetical protein
MLAGKMEHKDSVGNTGNLEAGSVQWMTAGRGIVHSEMPQQEDGLIWGFQLWVNLPASDKMTAPRYQDVPPEQIPVVAIPGGSLRVVAGSFGDVTGPVGDVATEPLYLDLVLSEGAVDVPVPEGHTAFAYVFEGSGTIADVEVERGQFLVLEDGDEVSFSTEGGLRALFVAGRPIGEPIVQYGPFVMNSMQEIQDAIRDYQAGRFAG